jgi:DNA modification methylase
MKPYYGPKDGITIYHGDCRELIGSLDANVVVTDPPYGIAHPTDYLRRGRSNLARCSDYPKVHGDDKPFDPEPLLHFPAILWGANHYASRLPDSSGWLVWDKLRGDDLDQSRAELAWSSCHRGVRLFTHRWDGFLRQTERGENYHPTQKPVALMTWVLSFTEGTILDPYMGSGPVLVAAALAGRRAIGIEIEEKYCEIAAKRLGQRVLDMSASNPPRPSPAESTPMSSTRAVTGGFDKEVQ